MGEAMQFEVTRLHVLAYTAGFTLWVYRLAEDELVVAAHSPGYFDAAGETLSHGDTMHLSGPDGCALRWVQKRGGHVCLRVTA